MTTAVDAMASAGTVNFTGAHNNGPQIGYNFGLVNYNSTMIARSETPPSPSSFVPFPPDPHFVDRGTLLDQIHERCFAQTSWTALVGLGGVG